jgi:hypothetical protein
MARWLDPLAGRCKSRWSDKTAILALTPTGLSLRKLIDVDVSTDVLKLCDSTFDFCSGLLVLLR